MEQMMRDGNGSENNLKNLRRGVHFAYTCLRRYKMWRLACRNAYICVNRAKMAYKQTLYGMACIAFRILATSWKTVVIDAITIVFV